MIWMFHEKQHPAIGYPHDHGNLHVADSASYQETHAWLDLISNGSQHTNKQKLWSVFVFLKTIGWPPATYTHSEWPWRAFHWREANGGFGESNIWDTLDMSTTRLQYIKMIVLTREEHIKSVRGSIAVSVEWPIRLITLLCRPFRLRL